jgi:hypothetical protein
MLIAHNGNCIYSHGYKLFCLTQHFIIICKGFVLIENNHHQVLIQKILKIKVEFEV